MRYFITVTFAVICSLSFGQKNQLWLSAGVNREVVKHITVNVGSTYRINFQGDAETWFQEIGVKSDHISWFRPSVDYRLVTTFDELRNSNTAQRLNFNADFRGKFKDVKFGTRLRYQIYLSNQKATGGDLDQAYRIKPYLSYDIPKTKIKAQLSTEFFYNPIHGPNGDRFNRVRYGFSLDFDLPKRNALSLTYYYGRKFNVSKPYVEHLVSLDYSYEWKKKKKKN